jgi:hypothetical protein
LLCVSSGIGCASAEADPAPVFLELPVQQVAPEPVEECTLVNPDPELLSMVEAWAVRWTAASGRCLKVSPDGIPMELWPLVFIDESTETLHDTDPQLVMDDVCGATTKHELTGVVERIVISSDNEGCTIDETVGHELGHIWGAGGEHAEEGIMAPGDSPKQVNAITEATLEWVCSEVDCPVFAPEPAPPAPAPEVRQCQTLTSVPGQGYVSVWAPCP